METARTVESTEERKFAEYRLSINGVFGRNRKAKFATHSLMEVEPEATVAESVLRHLVNAKLREEKVKPGARWAVSRGPREEEITRWSDGTSIRSVKWMLFSDVRVLAGEVT